MNRELHWYDTIIVNIYYLGLTTISQTNTLVIPLLVQVFVGEQVKGTYLGTLRLWTLMVALLAQALFGMLSDRNRFPLGRRRPFIFIGTLLNMACISAIGLVAGLSGMAGFTLLFVIIILQQISSNIAHGAQQGLIPDLVAEDQRGRYSAVKAVLELPLPLILVSFTVGRMVSQGKMWSALLLAMGVLFVSMLITMLAPERRLEEKPAPIDWKPFLRLLAMTASFTLVILGAGGAVRLLGSWLAGSSLTVQVVLMGFAGLFAMLLAIGLGVWSSVRLSLGETPAHQTTAFTWWVVNRLAYLVGAVNLSIFAVYYIQARLGYGLEKAAGPASIMAMLAGLFIMNAALSSGWLSDRKYWKAFGALLGSSLVLGAVVFLLFRSVLTVYLVSCLSVFSLFLIITALRLPSRFGHKGMVAFAGLVATVGTLVALLSPTLFSIYLGGAIIGIATGLFYTSNWALGTELVPKAEAGRYLGISNLAGAGAGAVGAYIGGPIVDYFAQTVPQIPGLGYIVLFTIYGMLFLFSVLALHGVVRPVEEIVMKISPVATD